MKPANNAPIYIGAYKELAEIARSHGYAMAVHGSLARDMDLICIPWTESASDPDMVVDAITSKFAFGRTDKPPSVHEHGRIVYTLIVSFGECFIDLSFMPRSAEITTLRARLETVEAETRELCAKAAEQRYTRETVRKSSSGEPYAAGKMAIFAASTIAAAIRNLEPRHD